MTEWRCKLLEKAPDARRNDATPHRVATHLLALAQPNVLMCRCRRVCQAAWSHTERAATGRRLCHSYRAMYSEVTL